MATQDAKESSGRRLINKINFSSEMEIKAVWRPFTIFDSLLFCLITAVNERAGSEHSVVQRPNKLSKRIAVQYKMADQSKVSGWSGWFLKPSCISPYCGNYYDKNFTILGSWHQYHFIVFTISLVWQKLVFGYCFFRALASHVYLYNVKVHAERLAFANYCVAVLWIFYWSLPCFNILLNVRKWFS